MLNKLHTLNNRRAGSEACSVAFEHMICLIYMRNVLSKNNNAHTYTAVFCGDRMNTYVIYVCVCVLSQWNVAQWTQPSLLWCALRTQHSNRMLERYCAYRTLHRDISMFLFLVLLNSLYQANSSSNQYWTAHSDNTTRINDSERTIRLCDRNNPIIKLKTSLLLVLRSKFTFCSFVLCVFVRGYPLENLECSQKSHA